MPHISAKVTRSKAQITRNSCSIKLDDLTAGQLLALLNALGLRAQDSTLSRELYDQVLPCVSEAFPSLIEGYIDPDTTDLRTTTQDRLDDLMSLEAERIRNMSGA